MVRHIKGDIFQSNADIIIHQVNCQGVMGSGVAKQVREKYPVVYEAYRELCSNCEPKKRLLGVAQPVVANDKTTVVNVFSQENFGYDGRCYTDYDALRKGLEVVRDSTDRDTSIAIPYLMGCHRGGGDWSVVSKMIEEIFNERDVTLYEYNGG